MSTINRDIVGVVQFTYPLIRRVRPAAVTSELSSLEGLSSSSVLRRVTETIPERQLTREALIAVCRAYVRAGDRETSNIVFVEIIRRVSGSIANRMRRWNGIPASMVEDARQTIIVGLYDFITSLESGEELWECNFTTCFDARLLTLLGKLTRRDLNVTSIEQLSNDEQSGVQFEARDPVAEAEFLELEVKEALTYLNGIDPRMGKAFYLKFFAELSENEIADLMEVSGRSVRYWIGSSKELLKQYYAER